MTSGKLLAAAALALLTSFGVRAETAEEFYAKQKSLDLVVGNAANSTYDLWARQIAHHMPKYLPGNPTIVVKNMPGGGGITQANWLYNQAPRDGSVFGVVGRNTPGVARMGQQKSVQYDPLKFGWLGATELAARACVVRSDTGIKTPADAQTKEVLMGGSGAGGGTSFMPTIANNLVGTKFKVIAGYKGSDEIHLAIQRGEVSGECGGYGTLVRNLGDRLKSGELIVLFSFEQKRMPATPNVPTIVEYIKDAESRQIFAFLTSATEIGRPFTLPPEVPADRLDYLRRAFDKTVKDPEFIADCLKVDLELNPKTGEELSKVVADLYTIPQPIMDKAIAMMPEGGLGD
jgi:tripartite-type tricarboxylate transporter receptor subunit TctC